jgi:hypothetical protein
VEKSQQSARGFDAQNPSDQFRSIAALGLVSMFLM